MSPLRIEPLATTGIGSLPHAQVEPALAQAFSVDIPYLPQLPRRDPAETMVFQTLDGLPGLRRGEDGRCTVRLDLWRREVAAFGRKLDRALSRREPSPFEPQVGSWRAWRPFLAELSSREVRLAKAQVCGPVTCLWSLRLDDGRPAAAEPDLARQIVSMVLARALALTRAVSAAGAAPIVFLDEPGLVSLDPRNPQHGLRLSELRRVTGALSKEGARVGIHCCGGTLGSVLLSLGAAYLSFDARLSLAALLAEKAAFAKFLEEGGRLALGITAADGGAAAGHEILAALGAADPDEKVLGQCLLTPACGLASGSPAESQRAFADLDAARTVLRGALGPR